MLGPRGIHIGSTAGDLEARVVNAQVIENSFGRPLDTVDQFSEVSTVMQIVTRLPAFPGLEIVERRSAVEEGTDNRLV